MKPRSKHSNAKKTACMNGHIHDSRKEARRCNDLHILQSAGAIIGLRNQPRYDFHIAGRPVRMGNGQCARVTLDFAYFEIPGERAVAEDVKGRSKLADSRDWPLRRAIFKALYPEIELREIR